MLFESFKIKNKKVKNRIVMAPMVSFSFNDKTGHVNEKVLNHYKKRAKENIGIIIVESAGVSKGVRAFANQLSIDDNKYIDSLKKLSSIINENDCLSILQLHNPGYMAKKEYSTKIYGPSKLEEFENAKELSLEEIDKIKNDFINAAIRSKEAGFMGIELHGAHRYLLNQFTSPIFNKREDLYGGSLENRFRLPLEIVRGIKKALGEDFLIFYRYGVNCPDIESGIKGAKLLSEAGVDALHISYTTRDDLLLKTDNPNFNYSVCSAKIIKENVNIPVIAVNMISTKDRGEYLLKNNYCDFVAYGREFLADAAWASKSLKGEKHDFCKYCEPKCHYHFDYRKCPYYLGE